MAGEEGSHSMMKIPEGCISHTISLTSPADACRSAAVSTIFRSAADSDTVWERFLPADCDQIIARAVRPVEFSSKKDLYFQLCDSILVDSGMKRFWLEKSTGRKCYKLSARELEIAWGDTSEYWNWRPLDESRFPEVAELVDVCWLDIRGRLNSNILSARTNYAAYLIFNLAEQSCGLSFPNQNASVRVGSHNSQHEVCLEPQRKTHPRRPRIPHYAMMEHQPVHTEVGETSRARGPHARADGWMEMELGEFFSGDGDDGEVEMLLWETEFGHWKSGLIIEGIEVKPK